MKRKECIIDCVGPDCEGCQRFKPEESSKGAEAILRRYWIASIDNPETLKRCVLEAMEQYRAEGMREDKPENFDSLMTHDKETIARWYLDLINGKGAKEQLLRYKIWENIFGSDYESVETLIEGYFEYLKQKP
jgi:hypothetical protein